MKMFLKKILVWIACLLVAALIAQLIPGCVRSDTRYMTRDEAEAAALAESRTVGILTMVVYGVAIFFAIGLCKGLINKKDPKSVEKARKDAMADAEYKSHQVPDRINNYRGN